MSVTTPLFIQHDEDFVSPTKPLAIVSDNHDEGSHPTVYLSSEMGSKQNKEYSFKSLSSMSNSSFQTAPSMRTQDKDWTEEDEADTTFRKPSFEPFAQDNSSFDATPVIGPNVVTKEELETPKGPEIDSFNVTKDTYEEEFDESLDREPQAGLGLGSRRSAISIGSYIETANATKIVSSRSSPVKAIRTSMIINGQLDYSSTNEQAKKGLGERDLYNVAYNNKSFGTDINERPSQLSRKPTLKKNSEVSLDDDNFAYLFIIAIHSFNAESLQNPDDVSICLSFEKGDVAFVHTVDESGWGEVTLIRNRKRGWVPFNYFSDTVRLTNPSNPSRNDQDLIESRSPLQILLSACAQFFLHPQETPVPHKEGLTFNVAYINGIRDGVKAILEKTDCVSRSNDFVQQKSSIRKARKILLANWYDLMIKADYHKHTTSPKHIDNLMNLVYEVLNQAFEFFNTWSKEKTSQLEKADKDKAAYVSSTDNQNSLLQASGDDSQAYLQTPPSAMSRLHEVYDLLFMYVGLILGRLDMIEHNPCGVEALEYIVHEIIILLRELLYISKSCSAIIQEKFQHAYENTLHKNLDPLFLLVSELVSCVKVLVTQTLQEDIKVEKMKLSIKGGSYHFTDQGERLLEVVSSMTTLIWNSINGCSSYLRLIGDFQLSDDRKYIDFQKIKMTPEKFFQKCSLGLTRNIDRGELEKTITEAKKQHDLDPYIHKRTARFSCVRIDNNDELTLTYEGTQFLQDYLPDQKPFGRDSTFEPFKPDDKQDGIQRKDIDEINVKEKMNEEVILAQDGTIAAASFRALVYKLTDEFEKPDDSFYATCLLNFRSFGTALDLIDYLISRFDLSDKSSLYDHSTSNGQYSSRSSRVKNRRKLVVKVFQTWMESFWDFSSDYKVLPTMINFFNEGMSLYLPIEAKTLIEIAARLSASKPTSKAYKRRPKIFSQLKPFMTQQSRCNSIYSDMSSSSVSSRLSVFSLDEKIIEEYELSHVPSRGTSSLTLPLPVLNLGTSSLLSKRNYHDIERLVSQFRVLTGRSMEKKVSKTFVPKTETSQLITEWNELVCCNAASPPNMIHNDLNLADLNPLELAKQLTLIESQLFMKIEPTELLDGKFLGKKLQLGLSPNVAAILDFTNELSNYVMESILYPSLSQKTRTARVKAWLKIALSSSYFRNYNSVASIMTALQNHAISRLGTVWDGLRKKDMELFEYLSRIIHPNNNFKVYRKKLKRYVEDGSATFSQQGQSPVPVVPFFNLFLQDLTFIYEGNSTYRNPDSFRPHKLVNIGKFQKVTKTLNIISYFQVDYQNQNEHVSNINSFFDTATDYLGSDTKNVKPIYPLQEFILYELWRVDTLHSKNSDRAYQQSLLLSPRK